MWNLVFHQSDQIMRKNILKLNIKKIFIKHNMSDKHAKICSDYLIKSELMGASSHGLARLKMYCDRIKKNLSTQNQR